MKAKELIEILSQAPEAEVGYEHLKITNAWIDSDQYIELDGQTARVNYVNQSSGIFVVFTEYEDEEPEVNAVCRTREIAEKFKGWIEKYPNREDNGHGTVKGVTIKNMFILG